MARTPIHPGKILGDELEELGVTAVELARAIRIPPNRISPIVARKRNVTADTALHLGKWFGMSARLWLNLQQLYDLRLAEKQSHREIALIGRRPDLPQINVQ
jgi:addiction module HigA family antidote